MIACLKMKKMGSQTKKWLCISFVFFLLIPTIVRAEKLSAAYSQWPPWKIIEQDRIEGIDAKILRTIGRRLGFSITFIECPWPRCLEMVKDGEVDLITSLSKTTSRQTFVYYLGPPYIVDHLAFYVMRGNAVSIQRYSDLFHKNIGTIKGSVYFPRFDDDTMLEKTSVNVEGQLFRMLSSKRIDAFIGFETVIDYLLVSEGFEGRFNKASFRVPGTGAHIAISKRSKKTRRRHEISKLIKGMVEDGEIERIRVDFLKAAARRAP